MEDKKSRFAITNAELNERTRKAALRKANSKILKLLESSTDKMMKDFLENPVIDGFYSSHDLKTLYMATVRPILKGLPDIYIKELILYGERRVHAKAGGNGTGVKSREKNAERDKKIIHRYQKFCEAGKKRDAAAIIAKTYKLTPTQVRNIIRKKNEN